MRTTNWIIRFINGSCIADENRKSCFGLCCNPVLAMPDCNGLPLPHNVENPAMCRKAKITPSYPSRPHQGLNSQLISVAFCVCDLYHNPPCMVILSGLSGPLSALRNVQPRRIPASTLSDMTIFFFTSCSGTAFRTRIEGKSVTETSTKSRMTAANAAPALMQYPQTATEIASSRLLETVMNERVVVLEEPQASLWPSRTKRRI